jgi:hypothetical protein
MQNCVWQNAGGTFLRFFRAYRRRAIHRCNADPGSCLSGQTPYFVVMKKLRILDLYGQTCILLSNSLWYAMSSFYVPFACFLKLWLKLLVAQTLSPFFSEFQIKYLEKSLRLLFRENLSSCNAYKVYVATILDQVYLLFSPLVTKNGQNSRHKRPEKVAVNVYSQLYDRIAKSWEIFSLRVTVSKLNYVPICLESTFQHWSSKFSLRTVRRSNPDLVFECIRKIHIFRQVDR